MFAQRFSLVPGGHRVTARLTGLLGTAALTVVATLGSVALTAPAASAAITPAMTLTEATTTAGSTANLGVDITFAPTSSDTVKDLTLTLPAGLLANADIDNGACLNSATPATACQVGTASVTAATAAFPRLPLTLPATYDLVAPPSPGDLAGLQLIVLGKALGTPAAITVRPSSDPAGVGLNIAFTSIPNTFTLLGITAKISVSEINSTFVGLRFPDSCPATPAAVSLSADSYAAGTVETAAAALKVTGCGALPYAPAFTLKAAQDSGDRGVLISTDITQTAGQATSKTVTLGFPSSVLSPNVAAVLTGGILCANPASGTCKAVGSASATSPLYPRPLAGAAYLTGSLTAPSITIVFPPPFALTLNGTVDLATNATTFTNVPDIPLTDLNVTLSGGPDAVYESACSPSSGTATATLTSQNGDLTASPSSAFAIANCTAATPPGVPGATTNPPPPVTTPKAGTPKLSSVSFSGLTKGKPSLSFKLAAGANAPKLGSVTVKLPSGLSVVSRRVHGKLTIAGVTLTGAKVKSLTLSHGALVITLKSATAGVTVKLGAAALKESAGLESKARHRTLKSLALSVIARNAKRQNTTLSQRVTNLHL
ncbi:MAG: hypothetical protein ABSH51_13205 [Solirubrobacteraceae bacterium]|jgi:hypothetical protein